VVPLGGVVNLAERRIVHDFETNLFPGLKERVEKAAGFPIPLEVSWETLAVAGESRLYAECWSAIYFEPLIGALGYIGRDEMGHRALQSGLKKVVLQNVKGCVYGDCWATLVDVVLTLDHESLTNASDVESRTKGLIGVLESSL
jgi:hypothetical protein